MCHEFIIKRSFSSVDVLEQLISLCCTDQHSRVVRQATGARFSDGIRACACAGDGDEFGQ